MCNLFLSLIFFLTSCSNNNRTMRLPNYYKEVINISIKDTTFLSTGWYYIENVDTVFQRQLDKSDKIYYINPLPIVNAKNITTVKIYKGKDSKLGLVMRLDKEGTEKWRIATEQSIGGRLAFILDNQLLYVPIVNSPIWGGTTALNRGGDTKEELKRIKKIIQKEKR